MHTPAVAADQSTAVVADLLLLFAVAHFDRFIRNDRQSFHTSSCSVAVAVAAAADRTTADVAAAVAEITAVAEIIERTRSVPVLLFRFLC